MWRRVALLGTLFVLFAGCSDSEPLRGGQTKKVPSKERSTDTVFLPADGPSEKDYSDLHNLLQVTGTIYSGAEPKTEAAFAQLAKLGVKTIVSVDGARPNLEMAKKYGMRYVHIPIGYDRLDPHAVAAFARAADEVQGKMYVHCHHGRHRGPAGAAAVCVATGQVSGKQALKILERAGTSRGYPGLWRDVEAYARPPVGEKLPKLVSVAQVDSIAAAMAQLDRASDNLNLCQKVHWTVPPDHPDLVPAREAEKMIQGLEATQRHLSGEYDNDEFRTWLRDSIAASRRFAAAVRADNHDAATMHFSAAQTSCNTCHKKYRN